MNEGKETGKRVKICSHGKSGEDLFRFSQAKCMLFENPPLHYSYTLSLILTLSKFQDTHDLSVHLTEQLYYSVMLFSIKLKVQSKHQC